MTVTRRSDDPEAVALAVAALADGSVVAVPTDTVYGLAVDPYQPEAVRRLFALKGRPSDVALPVLVARQDQIEALAGRLVGIAGALADRFWPGPLTLVVPRRAGFAVDLGGPPSFRKMVGIRWPAHPLTEDLCHRLGPLAVTSANIHGAPPATTAAQVEQAFVGADEPAVILDAGECNGIPSTVVECRGSVPACLRNGAIPWAEILESGDGGPSSAASR